ncbi:MAG: putative phosphoribosyltransferase [Solimicrobium sp.]|jgi:putative phosphoribosyl transferase|nr:putative phosphoribosyltransferase [Solimicrobium sp.]
MHWQQRIGESFNKTIVALQFVLAGKNRWIKLHPPPTRILAQLPRRFLMTAQYKEYVEIKVDSNYLEGMLEVPENAVGIVAFSLAGDSDRLSPRNNYLAAQLRKAHIGTLLINLLTKQENQIYASRFNINLLTQRLNGICHWIEQSKLTSKLPLGLFGINTGVAAILQVAATHSKGIAAMVGCRGRPDLANQRTIKSISAPTLFIVGGRDPSVLTMNRRVYFALNCKKKLEIISGATHLFEEPGALEKVAELAVAWFLKFMVPPIFAHHSIKI